MKKHHHLRVVLSLIVVLSMLVSLVPATVSAAALGTAPQKGTGTAADPYNIDEPLELVWMGENYGAIKNSCFIQTADIDMSSVANFTPIGNGDDSTYGSEADNFAGVFDGLGFKITKLTINSNLVYVGLFQRLSGTIRHVNLVQASITSTCSGYNYPYTGGIAGYINGDAVIKNCSVSGSVSQSSTAGGGMTGGIAGENCGAVSDCFCSAAVTATNVNGQAGGIVAYTIGSASVSRCGFSGSVAGAVATVGSIVGNYFQGTIASNVFLIGSAPFGCGSANNNVGCTPADISQIKLQKTYTDAGWNFDSVWKMDPVTGYPTFRTAPGIPKNIAVVSGNNQITVQWDAAEYASGYNVYYGTAAGIYGAPITASGTSAVISGLTNMTLYYIAVKALQASMEGTVSTEKTCTPHIIITDLAAAGSLSSVNISFTAPAGASLVELQQSTDSGVSYAKVAGVTLTSASTGTVLTGLAAGTYKYRLRLIFAGTEVFSNTSSASVGGSYTKNASASVDKIDYTTEYLYVGCYYNESSGMNEIDDAALKFDLSDCAGTVKNAYLYIYVSEEAGWNYGNAVFDLYGHSDDTWTTNMPAYPSVPSNSTLIQTGVTNLALGEYKQLTVTDFVKSQFAANDKVMSFYLAGQLTTFEAQDDAYIASASNPTHKPRLVIEFANTNANLSGIKIDGTSVPGFSAGTTSYSYTAPHDTDLAALQFTSTLADSSAVQGAWAYNATNHTWSVTVTAPDGSTTKTYTVSVSAALKSSDASLTSISIGGAPLAGFSSSVLDYSLTVLHSTAPGSLLLSSVKKDHMAVQSGWLYNATNKKWSNTVTAEDGTIKTYTVTINVLPDTDATLKSIKIGGTDITGFSPSVIDYNYSVVHGTVIASSSFVSATNDSNAIQGTWTYNSGTGKWSVLVTAEDGTTQKTYTVTIHELASADATLKSIKVNGTDISGFTPATLVYNVNVAHGTVIMPESFVSVTNDHGATQQNWTFDPFTGKWIARVTAEDGVTELLYFVIINQLPSTDAALKSITIGGTEISGFLPTKLDYVYSVAHGSNGLALSLTSTVNDHMAQQGTWTYDVAADKWSVTVTAEDNSTQKTYTVTIQQLPSNDASLGSIKINGTAIESFSPTTLRYTVNVPHGSVITPESFVSTASDANANQLGWMIEMHTGEWIENVLAEDGVTRLEYIVTINELPSTDATLKSIKVNGTAVSNFSPTKLYYSVDVVHGATISAASFVSVINDPMAMSFDWFSPASGVWCIRLIAEDNDTSLMYTVIINELRSTDATLKSITVGGAAISEFLPDTLDYTYIVAHGTVFTPASFVSPVTDHMAQQGAWSYNAVTGKWSVTVTAEDTTTQKTYTVTIHELADTDATLTSIKVKGTDVDSFLPSTLAYSFDVTHGTVITAADFSSATNDSNAMQGTWTYNSGTRQWSVLVTAEDGTTAQLYTVTIHELPSTDATLKSIIVNGIDISGISPLTLDYIVYVPHNSQFGIEAVSNDHMATAGGWNNYDSGIWIIKITAEDGITSLTYTVTIVELPSTDATLNGITVDGTDISEFQPSTLNYTYTVAHGTIITAANFAAAVTDDMAQQGPWEYDAVTGKWSVKVTAEDGITQKIYTVTIHELPDIDATLKSIKVNGTDITGFSSSTFDYSVDMAHGTVITDSSFASETNDVNALQGAWTYSAVTAKWSVLVTAEDGTTVLTYTVTINELPSTDATLTSINIGGTDISGFSSSTLDYTYDVVHGTDGATLSLSSALSDPMAQQGTWSCDALTDKWSLLVTAEDGRTQKTYTVSINELPSTDAYLKSITVGGAAISEFLPSTLDYTYTVAHDTVITVASFASAVNDHMAQQGPWEYDAVTGKWSVKVTAHDNSTQKIYTVTINELPDTDATLKSIKVNGTDIQGFSSAAPDYTVDVAHGTVITDSSFASETNDVNALQGAWTYSAVTAKWSVLVTAEDGTTVLTYTVTINELPDTDATLTSINIGGTDISGFSSSTLDYTYDVVHGTDGATLSLASAASDSMAQQGTWSYDALTDKWSVLVTAEDGRTQKTYTVTINELPDTDATLKSLAVNGTAVSSFLPSTLDYTCTATHGTVITAASFASAVTDNKAAQGTWTYSAATGKWSVLVTAEDGRTQKTYTVTINELPDTDATLKSIRIGGTVITGFSPLILDYTYSVAHGTVITAADIVSAANDENAVQGIWTYNSVTGKWSLVVTAEDGSTQKTYTVTIHELPSTDASLKSIKIGGTDISGFSASTLIYTYSVVHGTDISALTLTSLCSDHMASQGTWTYNVSAGTWSVTVTAQDTLTKRTYTVAVNELPLPSTDASLKSIKIGGTDIAGFLPSTLDYTFTALYGSDLAGLVFTSACSDANAAQSAWTYDSLNHKWSVTVTAQDTTVQKTYSVSVAEGQAPTGVRGDYRTNTLSYQSHVQDIGWQDAVNNGNISGTTGQSKRLEAVRIKLQDVAGGIEYCTHVQDIGWMDWSTDGNISGTTAQSKRLEALKIRLTGEAAEKYDIYYRVHVQDIGWMDWAKNGESAGTAACSYRMESIQIVMVLKGEPAPGPTAKAFYNGHTTRYNEQ